MSVTRPSENSNVRELSFPIFSALQSEPAFSALQSDFSVQNLTRGQRENLFTSTWGLLFASAASLEGLTA
jgi:hypothetical protein